MRKGAKRGIIAIAIVSIVLYFVQFNSPLNINIGGIKWWVEHHNYSYTKDDTKNIYIIIKDGVFIKYKKYNVTRTGEISIEIPKTSEFVVSLDSNSTISYEWDIINKVNSDKVKFERSDYMEPYSILSNIKRVKDGESRERKNLYFKTVDSGNEKIKLKYHNQKLIQTEYEYNVAINIAIK
jgi:predicted secreted protein